MIKVIGQSSVKIDPVTGLIRVDGIIVCKKVTQEGQTFLQFKDGDRMRSNCRRTNLVEISLEDFITVINKIEVLG